MAKESALVVSGQFGKPVVAVAVMAAGLFVSDVGRRQSSPSIALLTIASGIAIGFCAGLWLVRSVQCPRCGARWYWIAVTEASAFTILSGGLTMDECQRCGYPHE